MVTKYWTVKEGVVGTANKEKPDMYILNVFLYVPYEGPHYEQGPFVFQEKDKAIEAGKELVAFLEEADPHSYDSWSWSITEPKSFPDLKALRDEAMGKAAERTAAEREADNARVNKSYIKGADKLAKLLG